MKECCQGTYQNEEVKVYIYIYIYIYIYKLDKLKKTYEIKMQNENDHFLKGQGNWRQIKIIN